MKLFKKQIGLMSATEKEALELFRSLTEKDKSTIYGIMKEFRKIQEQAEQRTSFPAENWEKSPKGAKYPNLYAEIALRVCATPEGYANAAGVTEEVLYNAVYAGTDELSEEERTRLADWIEQRTNGRAKAAYLFAPAFSVYHYADNMKHARKLIMLYDLLYGVRSLAKQTGNETVYNFLTRRGTLKRFLPAYKGRWVSRAWFNAVLQDIEMASEDLIPRPEPKERIVKSEPLTIPAC